MKNRIFIFIFCVFDERLNMRNSQQNVYLIENVSTTPKSFFF